MIVGVEMRGAIRLRRRPSSTAPRSAASRSPLRKASRVGARIVGDLVQRGSRVWGASLEVGPHDPPSWVMPEWWGSPV